MQHLLTTIIVAIFATIIISCSCSKEDDESVTVIVAADTVGRENQQEKTKYKEALKDDGVVHTLGIKPLYGFFRSIFSDTNGTHLAAAESIGIEPIVNLRHCYRTAVPLIKVSSCDAYYIDSLRFSLPYLVPKAEKLLAEIGQRFSDSVFTHSGARYRIKVTSLLRTNYSVAKLRRRNRNSTDRSVHRYGTTFDISYSKFIREDSSRIVSEYDMKHVLAHILKDLKDRNRCYVKYEVKQCCFHITVRN